MNPKLKDTIYDILEECYDGLSAYAINTAHTDIVIAILDDEIEQIKEKMEKLNDKRRK